MIFLVGIALSAIEHLVRIPRIACHASIFAALSLSIGSTAKAQQIGIPGLRLGMSGSEAQSLIASKLGIPVHKLPKGMIFDLVDKETHNYVEATMKFEPFGSPEARLSAVYFSVKMAYDDGKQLAAWQRRLGGSLGTVIERDDDESSRLGRYCLGSGVVAEIFEVGPFETRIAFAKGELYAPCKSRGPRTDVSAVVYDARVVAKAADTPRECLANKVSTKITGSTSRSVCIRWNQYGCIDDKVVVTTHTRPYDDIGNSCEYPVLGNISCAGREFRNVPFREGRTLEGIYGAEEAQCQLAK